MAVSLPSSLDITQAAELRPIAGIAAELGLRDDEFDLYGRYKAKVSSKCSTGYRRAPTRKSSRSRR